MRNLYFILLLLACAFALKGNNIAITNLRIAEKNTTSHYRLVQFDIAWENSWRNDISGTGQAVPYNWDAAWVFVKYRVGTGEWQHAWLNNSGHTAPSGSMITTGLLDPALAFNATTNPCMGAFIYRDANGTGAFSETGVKLRWNCGDNGISDGDIVEIQVFAIEMVYVPQGSFYVGSGGTELGSFTNGSWTTGATVPLSITSESALTIAHSAGNLWGTSVLDNCTIGDPGTLAAAFPKGFAAFYCMKYETSQQQYVDFLNCLTTTQASARYPVQTTNRYNITVSSGIYSTANPCVACNFLGWADLAAYLDWSALRPMTELEFEKACRGTATPVAFEFAGGAITVTQNTGITNDGANNETSSNSGNCTYNNHTSVQGPMRVGAFANALSLRTNAGSTYYGIMEMSGNVCERPITVGNATGRSFTGTHGDGTLNSSGIANAASWPDASGTGAGYRGGGWSQSIIRVSDRNLAVQYPGSTIADNGGRGVRTVPFSCGSSFPKSHLAYGGVAPVDKTVNYGTVSTTLFGGTKCAITQNLGATNQASSATDATEASAGWYWQFNRKQGYKLADDGTTRTPVTSWITFIDENSDWATANDPCTYELGTSWRIPTKTEWINADANGQIGGWDDIAEAYSDVLKLHAAGYLNASDGLLTNRGAIGFYWSSTLYDGIFGWSPGFTSSIGEMSHSSKAFGYSVRCLKELSPTLSTTAASVITATTATSGGDITGEGASVVTARGVCWGTSENPTIALATKTTDGTGTGSFTSALTGLAPGTLYHVRAYATNSIGTAYGNELSFTTAAPFVCGTSTITKNHITGEVAPVDKTVTYGTVSTTVFGGAKCAITQNLGADNQATAVDDVTEASAGWYWQFNRKQGYKHDGTTRTPATAWITTISENSEWIAANDPCALELGTGWHLPTNTEWTAADAGWTTWADPWGSVLKLHAAGSLYYSDGSLYKRGINGSYWSSTQLTVTSGWYLYFNSDYCYMNNTSNNLKRWGFTARCVKDLTPTLTTTAASAITATTTSSGGEITDQGGSMVTGRGVCWSTSANPTTALATKTTDDTGTGTFTSLLTGLNGNTLYYLRAYAANSFGTAYGNEVSFTTAAFICGTSTITKSHLVTSGVAPVDKTVTYGTVSTILFGGTKCAITQNLGADHQATAVDDATEASAGWYWQFNRKQGYKHDGTTRTPATVWITSINENSDWAAANDPCTLELGVAWHIPTYTEWTTADASWNNYNDTYASVLKLHAAGYLYGSNGSLYERGAYGHSRSSTQYSSVWGWNLGFGIDDSYLISGSKAYGFSARCLKDFFPTLTTTDASEIEATTATSGGYITDQGGSAVTVRGVCWNTSANPTATDYHTNDGSGIGSFTSSLTGLAPVTLYHIRAYATSTDGTFYGEDKSFTTAAFVCGSSVLTVNHVSTGNVAPVDKTLTYGTVSTTLFGGTKCAITQNLGADHQATDVYDATEASAGWYWQFNRKQGYKHDGATRTPGSAWNTTTDNSATWQAANDPCTMELGATWRIPTYSEWTAADANGYWTNMGGPWASVLKLHPAGYLQNFNGSLAARGSTGYYWSNTQSSATAGWSLYFIYNQCDLSNLNKAYGFGVRCIKDLYPTVSTTDASVITATTATSGGNITDQGGSAVTVRGVCWGTSASPTTALATKTNDGTGTGTFTSELTGLTPNTTYHIRAYATNTYGTSYGEDKTFATTAFICGTSPLSINHATSGGVAPVDKTVTYGTVTTTLFGETKCAITQNLGADHQATAVDDATEASAGWYWQFNRKQGYKADCANGSACFIPSSPAWNTTPDNLSSIWEAVKDPCTLELGTGWRIPTSTEWTSADALWNNYNDTYGSVLKLHAAGTLSLSGGLLSNRGSFGTYWSNTQSDASNSQSLNLGGWYSAINVNYKTYGFPVRCVRDWLPILNTTNASVVTATAATSGGNITSQGASAVTARGVCWSTSANPEASGSHTSDGAGTGSFNSYITGLAPITTYYVRAFATNNEGTSYGNEVSFTTAWACGSSLSKNHVTAGGVAPVDKTVAYGTVSTTLFGGTKCAITQNLGADHQATNVNDAAEASAGWYWQFNLKQGYKHDGATRTPATSWIVSLSESSDWTAAKDPCTLELGIGWHIPTNSEWTTADGSWTDWNGSFGSALKLHGAGYLLSDDGSLHSRGSGGYHWSSSQYDATNGWYLFFYSVYSGMNNFLKTSGFSIRCLRDLLPTLTTTAVTSITGITAFSGGTITDEGGSAVTVRGVCWSASANPTTALATKTTDGPGTGTFTSSLTGLAGSTTYYVRAYATNSHGTAYGNEVSFTTLLAIGNAYQGGKVAYILQPADPGYSATAQHGLIAALADQSTGIAWVTGGASSALNGNTSTAYGTGQANTNFMKAQSGYSGGAAQVCDDYTVTDGGVTYSDWYLPSKDELAKLHTNRVAIGGFASTYYWSSSEYDRYNAWRQNFSNGGQSSLSKSSSYYVRAVRTF